MGSFSLFLWKFGKSWNPVVEENKNLITRNFEDTVQKAKGQGIIIPKRYRIEFFNNEIGRAMRMDKVDHELLQRVNPKQACALCRVKTTCMCRKCQVHLCRVSHKNKNDAESCWSLFHTKYEIE